jgi:hypothetical protein
MAPRENPFPTSVKAITDLPESFQAAIDSLEWPQEPIHSILLLPPQPFLKRAGVPRQALLSTERGILHVRDGGAPAAAYLRAEDVLYVRQTLILLYGSIEFVGETNGQLVRIVAEYNSVGQNFLTAALNHFLDVRYETIHLPETPFDQTNYLLDRLGDESHKFMNGLRLYALQSGEELLGYHFQPRIREHYLRFITRPVAPASLFAMTTKAVILIEEEKARGAAYGWIITICPRNTVLAVESGPVNKWEKLRVLLLCKNTNEERNLLLEPETASACKSLWISQTSMESSNS